MGNPHGVVLAAPGEPTLYIAGDTDIFSDMALIAEFYEPTIAILPIGDRFTMDGSKAAVAAKRFLKVAHVIPCHFGTFPLLDANADKLVAGLAGSGITVHLPSPGETLSF
jgi:L-ascorbate metabolism protein UlaG (beta-lactamase superfamily)